MAKQAKQQQKSETAGNEPESDKTDMNTDIAPESDKTDMNTDITPESDKTDNPPLLKPCPQCKSTKVKPIGEPTKTDYRNVETIIKQDAYCEECGMFYMSRVSIPKSTEERCLRN